MKLFRGFWMAFSLYSRVPVPGIALKREDMKYMFCFFPWVGALTGAAVYLWWRLCRLWQPGELCLGGIAAALPLILTGGIHADGFLDTVDAFSSLRPREKKLEILKDSHIGAFALIRFACYMLIYLGAFSALTREGSVRIFCGGFFLSRCLCGIGALSFPPAKQEGMLFDAVNHAAKAPVRRILAAETAVCAGFMLCQSVPAGAAAIAAALASFLYCHRRCRKELGGITGDTEGYFVLLCEESILVAVALLETAAVVSG